MVATKCSLAIPFLAEVYQVFILTFIPKRNGRGGEKRRKKMSAFSDHVASTSLGSLTLKKKENLKKILVGSDHAVEGNTPF